MGGFPKRDMDGHLVAIEVGVEARANEWVETDGVTIDKNRLEGLDRKSMKGWSTVKKNRVLTNDFFDDVVDFRIVGVDEFIRLFMGGDDTSL